MGAEKVVPNVRVLIADDEADFPCALRAVFHAACEEVAQIEDRIHDVERQLAALAKQTPLVARLRSVPGVGLLTATALLAFVVDIHRFPSAREFASYLGLTPREVSSGARRRLGRISKRGDAYLRMLLIHGARAVLTAAKRVEHPDRLRSWALALEKRAKHNVATVALANKLARIIWAVWKNNSDYRSQPQPLAV